MTDVRPPRELATLQDGVVARWQLIRAGLSERSAECWVRGMQPLHDGVYLAGLAPPTQRQLLVGRRAQPARAPCSATRAPPRASACGRWSGQIVTVTRIGNRGREHSRGLHVSYSLTLRGQITEHEGIPITTVERTIIDLWPHLSPRARSRLLREGLRLGATAAPRMQSAIRAHRGRRGVASLRVEVEKLAGLAARALPLRRRGMGRRADRRRRTRVAGRQRGRRRRGGRPQLAGGTPHHRARRPQLPRPARRGHPQDEGLASGRLRRPAAPHAAVYAEPERLLAMVPGPNVGPTPS